MYHPTTRLLTILDLLQSYGAMTGKELSRRLEVDPRTVRRYVTMLQDMGIPIAAERGRDGAYFLRPDYKLPPLMFSAEEALVVALSLRVAKQMHLHGTGPLIEGVSAKIERVLPSEIRQHVQTLLDTLALDLHGVPTVETSSHVVLTMTHASYRHQSVRFKHRKADGVITERTLDPYGVALRVGRWYVVGFCHLRQEIRTFRLDRLLEVAFVPETFEPQTVNVMEYVEHALAKTPGIHQVEIRFGATLKSVRAYIPSAMGEVVEVDAHQTELRCYVQNLEWFAGFISGIPLPQKILRPALLREQMATLIGRVTANLENSHEIP